jgi:hypothetical protein
VLDQQRRKLLEICSKAFEDLAKPGISAESFNDLLDTFAEMQREYFDLKKNCSPTTATPTCKATWRNMKPSS